jgi:hypothetical protein
LALNKHYIQLEEFIGKERMKSVTDKRTDGLANGVTLSLLEPFITAKKSMFEIHWG